MTKDPIDDGGPAFPRSSFDSGHIFDSGARGMPLRDYFAAKAVQGFVASGKWDRLDRLEAAHFAEWSYEIADAMIEARKRGTGVKG